MLSYVLSLLFQSFWQIILSNDCNKPTVLKLHWKIKKVYEKYSLKISCWNNIFDVSGYYSVTILINAMPLSQYFFDFNKLLLYMYIHIYIYNYCIILLLYICTSFGCGCLQGTYLQMWFTRKYYLIWRQLAYIHQNFSPYAERRK